MKRSMIQAFCAACLVTWTSAWGAQRVLVMPLNAVNLRGDTAWIGAAVQQNIVADLGRNGAAAAVGFTGEFAAPELAAAVKAGQQTNSDLVVFGTYQSVEGEIRLTASVVDVRSSQVQGTAKATGAAAKLLSVEDALSEEVRRVVLGQAIGAPAVVTAPATQPAVAAGGGQPVTVVVNLPPNYTDLQGTYYGSRVQMPSLTTATLDSLAYGGVESYPTYSYPVAYSYPSFPAYPAYYGGFYGGYPGLGLYPYRTFSTISFYNGYGFGGYWRYPGYFGRRTVFYGGGFSTPYTFVGGEYYGGSARRWNGGWGGFGRSWNGMPNGRRVITGTPFYGMSTYGSVGRSVGRYYGGRR